MISIRSAVEIGTGAGKPRVRREGDEPYRQMRVFHLAALDDTCDDTVHAHPPPAPGREIRFGVYACSPGESSFTATFDRLTVGPCRWEPHADEPTG